MVLELPPPVDGAPRVPVVAPVVVGRPPVVEPLVVVRPPVVVVEPSMAAVTSDRISELSGKPEVNRMRVLRPGMSARFLARLRKASTTLRAEERAAPKSAT